jgi:hypothetical protein
LKTHPGIRHLLLQAGPLAAMLFARNALADTGPDPNAMGGYFGSVMGTSLTVALGALAIGAIGVIAVAIPWVIRGGRDVWDERSHKRPSREETWTVLRRAQHKKAHHKGS